MRHDLVVVGAGLFGLTVAERCATEFDVNVLVLERRDHIGGNAFSSPERSTGIEVHWYGTHVFHTSSRSVWDYVNRFSAFMPYRHSVYTIHDGQAFPYPVNLATICQVAGTVMNPVQARQWIKDDIPPSRGIDTFEERAISLVGETIYQRLIRGYTLKQWQQDPRNLPAELVSRIPLTFTYNPRYFADKFEGIPTNGYGSLVEKMADHRNIEIRTETEFASVRGELASDMPIVYSGPIDEYFDYQLGQLQWRTLDFEVEVCDVPDYQGAAVVNYADVDVPFTRIHEFSHLQLRGGLQPGSKTVIMKEFPRMAEKGDEPFYPVRCASDMCRLEAYRELAEREANVFFGGRLGSYRYIDMHMAIAAGLKLCERSIAPLFADRRRPLGPTEPKVSSSSPSSQAPSEVNRDATRPSSLHELADVARLADAYRSEGHLYARSNPLCAYEPRDIGSLISKFGFSPDDLGRKFVITYGGQRRLRTLRDIVTSLEDVYCGTTGFEYTHILDAGQREWIQTRVEGLAKSHQDAECLRLLRRLIQAGSFEMILHTAFPDETRYSLEGCEALIPVLDEVLTSAANDGLDEACIGMAHRGRLNVLANIVGISRTEVLSLFSGISEQHNGATSSGSGDVKFHLGAANHVTTAGGSGIRVSVMSNPSHLESVTPVLQGVVRGKQDALAATGAFPILPIAIHGDAAFAGQGVVAETLNLSQLPGYRTGGTIHIVLNNQVGHTATPDQLQSSRSCTDVGRMIEAPVLHVNADDPEACVRAARLAFDFRQVFGKDVIIDLVCYRRYGHYEADDPSTEQPKMSERIRAKVPVYKDYASSLLKRANVAPNAVDRISLEYEEQLRRGIDEAAPASQSPPSSTFSNPGSPALLEEAQLVSADDLKQIGRTLQNLPAGFTLHPDVLPKVQSRAASLSGGAVDWGTAEFASFGSLLQAGISIRVAGQDSRRGTFLQRFSVLVDFQTGDSYCPLHHLEGSRATFEIYDSPLSELAALGFEYGYSVARRDTLVMWEAQLGDFINGAQLIVDEYITSGRAKWGQCSGLVLLLPHGYEGAGPNHSSARIERFLQLAADDAFLVTHPSTPASYFHLLRMHALSGAERPLVVLTPKSMLSSEDLVSGVSEILGPKSFQPVLADPTFIDPASVQRVLLCSGMAVWDLATERKARSDMHTAILSIEQLYPLPIEEIRRRLAVYTNAKEVRWVQDEPANMGVCSHIVAHLVPYLPESIKFSVVARAAGASPATGSLQKHLREQAELYDHAFAERF